MHFTASFAEELWLRKPGIAGYATCKSDGTKLRCGVRPPLHLDQQLHRPRKL